MKLAEIARNFLGEMPVLHRQGRKVYTDKNINLKKVKTDELDENFVLYVSPSDTFLTAKGWFMLWFVNDPSFRDKLNKNEADWLMFPPSIGWGRNAPITDIWKKRMAGRHTDMIVGAVQGWILDEEKRVLLNMISVRPGWKRNHIATHMLKALRDYYSGYTIESSKKTDDGEKFFGSLSDKEKVPTGYDFRQPVG